MIYCGIFTNKIDLIMNLVFMLKANNMSTIKKIILEYLEEEKLLESGFARVRNMMHGLVDSIDTIGILSAQNPGKDPEFEKIKHDNNKKGEFNNRRHSEFKEKLKELNIGFIEPDYGMFDSEKEKSLLIPNINKNLLIKLAQGYGQTSCIFGTKDVNEEGALFKWEYIVNGVVTGTETVYTSEGSGKTQEKMDDYTKVKGRKFYIPFFTNYEKPEISKTTKEIQKDMEDNPDAYKEDAYKKPHDRWRMKYN